jgi:EpsI family protein
MRLSPSNHTNRGTRLSRRQVMLGAAMGLTGAAAQAFVPRQKLDILGDGKLEALIPNQVSAWRFLSKSGLVVPPSDELSDRLYSQLLTRVYVAEGRPPIMLLIAQSGAQDGVLQVHRPEVCYPASGYTLSGGALHALSAGGGALPTRVYTAEGGDRIEQLLYWTRVGNALPTTWLEQRMAVARANLRGQIPDGVLVRVSTIAPDRSAVSYLDQFARELIEGVSPYARRVLIGALI